MCRLRAKLKPFGVEIENTRGVGWSVSPAARHWMLSQMGGER